MAIAYKSTTLDGLRCKIVNFDADSSDAHTTALTRTFAADSISDLPANPTEYQLLVASRSNEVAQAFSITAISSTGYTIRKNTPAVGGGGAMVLTLVARCPRGVAS